MADPDARIPRIKLLALWREICQRINDPLLGLKLGSAFRARDLGLVGYIMAASGTLDIALRSLVRYSRIIADDVQFAIHPHGATLDLEVSAPVDLSALEHPIISRIASVFAVMREITESDLRPVALRLPQPAPPDPAPYHNFFRTKVRFAAGGPVLTLRTGDLDLPIPSADIALGHYLEDYASKILDSFPSDESLVHRIRRLLMIRLASGDPGIGGIASALGLNARTLQRRLREQGTNYRALCDSFRRATARQLLADPRISIKEISFLLGYQDLGAFYRAFRRWESDSPMDYRKKHLQGA